MGSCLYGAQVKAGEPDWHYVTKADIDTWFSGFPYLFLLWVYGWIGRGYSVPLLAILNPDVPAAVGWQDLISSSLVGGRFNVVGTLSDAMDDLIKYHVFQDHCVCVAPVSTYGWRTVEDVDFASAINQWQSATLAVPSGVFSARVSFSGLAGQDVAHTAFNLCTFQSGVQANCLGAQYLSAAVPGPEVTGGWPDVHDGLRIYFQAGGGYSSGGSNAISGHVLLERKDDLLSVVTPDPPGAVTAAGVPTVAPPSGTTSDQLMTQLLVQQFELRQLQDLIRSGPIGGSGLLPTPGTVHSGLSGDGEFDCVALQGIRVQLVGVPTSVDRWIAHPDQYLGAGQVSFKGQAGWTDNLNAAHLDQYIPCPVPASTKVGYHFLGGITATITEYPS